MNLLPRSTVSTCADVGSFIESETSVVYTSNVGFTSEVPDYLVVHTGPGVTPIMTSEVKKTLKETKNNKAPGTDNLTSDNMILGGEESVKQITFFK